jgi:hypothetical protein
MSTPDTNHKPGQAGFKPGANMPDGDYDPKKEGMHPGANHAGGHPANDALPEHRAPDLQHPSHHDGTRQGHPDPQAEREKLERPAQP